MATALGQPVGVGAHLNDVAGRKSTGLPRLSPSPTANHSHRKYAAIAYAALPAKYSTRTRRNTVGSDAMAIVRAGPCAQPPPARTFRSAGLAARDTRSAVGKHDNDARLRETHRIFLQAGSSYKAAASEFNLHFNALKYRVDRAIERRDRPITDDRLDVEIALLIATGPAPRIQRRYKTDCLRCSSVAAQ